MKKTIGTVRTMAFSGMLAAALSCEGMPTKEYNVEGLREQRDPTSFNQYAAKVEQMDLVESTALLLLDHEPDIFPALKTVRINNLTIYQQYVDLFERLPALKELVFDGCRLQNPNILRVLKEHFEKNGDEDDLNGTWRPKR